MRKIEEAIQDFIQDYITGLDFSDMITTEVRDTWDMDELDQIETTVDRVDALEAWICDAEDKLSIQNVINLEKHVEALQLRIRDLEDRLNDYEEIREMAWQSANKSFFQKLIFWR